MSLFIRDLQTVPDGGWRYPNLVGGYIVVFNYSLLYEEVVKHYTANGQPVPSQETVTLWLCNNLALPCYDGPMPFVNLFTSGLPSKFSQKTGCCK